MKQFIQTSAVVMAFSIVSVLGVSLAAVTLPYTAFADGHTSFSHQHHHSRHHKDGSECDDTDTTSNDCSDALDGSGDTTPAPTCSIAGSPQAINAGDPFSLHWTSTDATSATLDHEVGVVDVSGSYLYAGGLPPAGLDADETYTLSVLGNGGTGVCSTTILVTNASTSNAVENTPALCSDGIDNNANGLIDLEDPGCLGTLTLKLIINNLFGGTATTSDVALHVGAIAVFADAQNTFVPGTYDVSIATTTGYAVNYSTDCALGSVDLVSGDQKVCTITLSDSAPVATTTPETPPTPTLITDTGSGSGSSGGGGNGPIVGSYGTSNVSGGQVLGASIDPNGNTTGISGGSCSEYLTDYLGRGKHNNPEQVKKLQTFLNKVLGLSIPVTGVFGDLTFSAVQQFQLAHADEILKPWMPFGLSTDAGTGYVYKTTRRWINHLECGSLSIPTPNLP